MVKSEGDRPAAAGVASASALAPGKKRTVLERFGLRYFHNRSRKLPPVDPEDEVNYLNPNERAALKRIARGAVVRSGIAGGLSGLCTAIAEIEAVRVIGPDQDAYTGEQMILFWVIVGGVTLVATAFEIGFLYWDALRSVHLLSHAAGVDLFDDDEQEREGVALALVRAALELPNPGDRVLGVDPLREVSRLRMVVATLIYKAKIGVTNFLAKMVVRRFLGRGSVRFALPLLAVPVTAAWNAWVTWRVLREARLRVMGPSAAAEYVAAILGDPGALSRAGKLNMLRAVASSVVRSREMHPNHFALLAQIVQQLGEEGSWSLDSIDDWHIYLEELPTLPENEQRMALRLQAVAVIIDGRIKPRERELLEQAHDTCGHPMVRGTLKDLYRMFANGEHFDPAVVERVAPWESAAAEGVDARN